MAARQGGQFTQPLRACPEVASHRNSPSASTLSSGTLRARSTHQASGLTSRRPTPNTLPASKQQHCGVQKDHANVETQAEDGSAHRAVSLMADAIAADAVLSLGAGVILVLAAWPSLVTAWDMKLRLVMVKGALMLHACVPSQNTCSCSLTQLASFTSVSFISLTAARHASTDQSTRL
jgi:hypothetical protein